MTSPELDEFTRLDRELNSVSNALFDVEIEIKPATNEDPEVAEKIEAVHSAISDVKIAIENYRKRKANDEENNEETN